MPYARRRTKSRKSRKSRKPVRKTYGRRPAPFKRRPTAYKSARPTFNKMPAPVADLEGARFLAEQDPSATLYSAMARSKLAKSKMTMVNVRGKAAIADVYNCNFKWASSPIPYLSSTNPYYRGNTPIDPGDASYTGNAGYVGQIGALYAYYRVKSSRFTIHVTNKSDQPITMVMFATLIPPSQWGSGIPHTLAKWSVSTIPKKFLNVEQSSGSKNYASKSLYISVSSLFAGIIDEEDFSGNLPSVINTASTPDSSYMFYYGVTAYGTDGSDVTDNQVFISPSLTYYTQCYGPLPALEALSEDIPDDTDDKPDEPVPPKPSRKKSVAPDTDDEGFVPVKKARFPK